MRSSAQRIQRQQLKNKERLIKLRKLPSIRHFTQSFQDAGTSSITHSPTHSFMVLRDVITSDNANADSSALMTKISNSVCHTHMLYGTSLLRHGQGILTGNANNNVIQVSTQITLFALPVSIPCPWRSKEVPYNICV